MMLLEPLEPATSFYLSSISLGQFNSMQRIIVDLLRVIKGTFTFSVQSNNSFSKRKLQNTCNYLKLNRFGYNMMY